MSITDRVREAVRRPAPAESVVDRVEALRRFLRAVEDHLPEQRLACARTIVDRAGERLSLSREHSVVALAGATGSGKSSLFNACVWGPERAGELLDWLAVPPARRFRRESALDGEDERTLRGLVLLDLPDFDSVEEAHRVEVDRLLTLVDLVVWVLDPQKYADRVVHEQYLAQFHRHRDVTVVVLNQADLLGPADTERCLDDLERLLVKDGLAGVRVLATSAVDRPGIQPLRELLERTVAARQAALRRLGADVDGVVADLAPLVAPEAAEDTVDRDSVRALTGALARAAGVPVVASATARAYRHRAIGTMGWPVSRWLRKLGQGGDRRPDAGHLRAAGGACGAGGCRTRGARARRPGRGGAARGVAGGAADRGPLAR